MIIQPQKKSPSASETEEGLMSAADKKKLNGITDSADSVEFSQALTSGTIVGYITINGNKYTLYAPTNTDTKYSAMKGATSSAAGAAGLVPAPAAGKQASYLRGDGTWAVPPGYVYTGYFICSSMNESNANVANLNAPLGLIPHIEYGSIFAVRFTIDCTPIALHHVGTNVIVYYNDSIASEGFKAGDIATFVYSIDATSSNASDKSPKWVLLSVNRNTGGSSGDCLPLTGGVVSGNVQQSGGTTDYTTYKFRNIGFGTTSTPTSNSTYGGNGSIYFQYS